MVNFTVRLAELNVNVNAMFPETKAFCKDYIVEGEPDFSVTVTEEDIAFERGKSERTDKLSGVAVRNFHNSYLETLAVYRQIAEKMTDYDTLLFHGSAIAVDGECYLFTATSGTGKSTHTRLWREYFGSRAVMVNDDKPLLRVTDSGVVVYGTPWNGKHNLGENISAPLKAICILERDTVNRIEPIGKKAALKMLIQQTYRPSSPQRVLRTLELVDSVADKTELYLLGCNITPQAVEVSYGGMNNNKNRE